MALNAADMAVFTKIKLAAHTLRALPHDVRNWPRCAQCVAGYESADECDSWWHPKEHCITAICQRN